jgi:hypothetical protein
MAHVDGLERCCVAHLPGQGQCIRCRNCGGWIKPADMGGDCPGPRPKGESPWDPDAVRKLEELFRRSPSIGEKQP